MNISEKKSPRIRLNKMAILCGVLAVIIVAQACVLGYILIPWDTEWIDAPKPPLGDFINVMDKGAAGDGMTDDSKAVMLALAEAQEKGMDVYFPAGTYNFNGANLTANQNIRIFGDGESTILYEPGSIYCYNDIAVENLAVFKRTGIFIYLKPEGYSNVTVDNTKFYNDLEYASDDTRFVYAHINVLGQNRGVNNLIFTNNNLTKCQHGLLLKCEVKSGIIDNNILTDFGNPYNVSSTFGLVVGTVDSSNNWVEASNVTISNNTITGLYSGTNTYLGLTDSPAAAGKNIGDPIDYNVNAIQATGNNIKIVNNYIENQTDGAGIFSKANDLLISGNTIINAGTMSSICVKVTEQESNGSPIVIENNTIKSSIDTRGAIRVHATNFAILNNVIEQYDNEYSVAEDAATIHHLSNTITNAVIEGNQIYTEAKNGILISSINGYALIRNNTIKQNIVADTVYSSSSPIYIKNASSVSVIECHANNIVLQRGQMVLLGSSNNNVGSITFFTDNTVTAYEYNDYLIRTNNLTCNITGNTITAYNTPNVYGESLGKGLVSSLDNSINVAIDNNNMYFDSGSMSNIISMKSPFSMTNNNITFGTNSSVTSVVNYAPAGNADASVTSVISGNTVGNVTDILNGGKIANADSFILFNTSSSYLFPQMNIWQNSTVVNTNMLNTTSSSKLIQSVGSVSVDKNMIYSALNDSLGSDDAAVIASPQKQTSLDIGENIDLSNYIKQQIEEAERLAAEQAAADRLAAEQAAAEKAAADLAALEKAQAEEAEAKAAAEKAAAEAAEKAETAKTAADSAAKAVADATTAREAAEKAAAAEKEALEKAAVEAEAKAALEQAEAEKAEAERIAAEAAAKLAAAIAEKAEADRIVAEAAVRVELAQEAAEQAAFEKAEAERIAQELAQEAAEQAEALRIAEEAEKAIAEAEAAAAEVIPSGVEEFTYYFEKSGYLILQFAHSIDTKSSWNKVVYIDGKSYSAVKFTDNTICVSVKSSALKNQFTVEVRNIIFPDLDKKETHTIEMTFNK